MKCDAVKQALLAVATVVALSRSVQATTRDEVVSAIGRCGVIMDDRTWLNCVYGAAQPMRSQLGLPPAPASQTGLVPAASAMPSPARGAAIAAAKEEKESGGFFSYMFGGDLIITKMPLASYRFDSQGWFTVTLANGQVWQQRDGSQLAHWHGRASQYIASISKGAVGSYNLTIADEGMPYKVRRIQ